MPLLAMVLLTCWLLVTPAARAQEATPAGDTSSTPAQQIAEPDPAVPAPDPAPAPTDAARAATPQASGGSGGSSSPSSSSGSRAPSSGGTHPTTSTAMTHAAGSTPAATGRPAASRKRARARARRSPDARRPTRRAGHAAATQHKTSAPPVPALRSTPAGAAASTGPDGTALAGWALLALALAGGCLAAALARAERVGLGG